MYDTLKEKQTDDDILANERDSKTSLARLEKHIRDSYVSKGFVVGLKSEDDWGFKIDITTYWKHKTMEIVFAENKNQTIVFSETRETLTELFELAFKFFPIIKSCDTDGIICNICGNTVKDEIDRVTLVCRECDKGIIK